MAQPSSHSIPRDERESTEEPKPVYRTIPLPSRASKPSLRTSSLFAASFRTTIARLTKRTPISPEARARRQELFQSIGTALVINFLLILVLLTVHLDPPQRDVESFIVAKAATETKAKDPSAASAAVATPAADSARLSAAERGAIDIQTKIPPIITAPSLTSVQQEFESFAADDPNAFLGQSILTSEFAEIRKKKKQIAKNFVESKGTKAPSWAGSGQGKNGIGLEAIRGIFDGNLSGDGSNAVVFLDVSGSMRDVSHEVSYFMQANYKNALVHEVGGCSMKRLTDPFPATLMAGKESDLRTDYYFVCDLLDGETKYVIDAMKRFLAKTSYPRRLHIVSFDRRPGTHLRQLLNETGGTFLYGFKNPF